MLEATWVEYGLIAGLFGLILLAMLIFGRFFPLVPSPHGHGEAKKAREFKRRTAALAGHEQLIHYLTRVMM